MVPLESISLHLHSHYILHYQVRFVPDLLLLGMSLVVVVAVIVTSVTVSVLIIAAAAAAAAAVAAAAPSAAAPSAAAMASSALVSAASTRDAATYNKFYLYKLCPGNHEIQADGCVTYLDYDVLFILGMNVIATQCHVIIDGDF